MSLGLLAERLGLTREELLGAIYATGPDKGFTAEFDIEMRGSENWESGAIESNPTGRVVILFVGDRKEIGERFHYSEPKEVTPEDDHVRPRSGRPPRNVLQCRLTVEELAAEATSHARVTENELRPRFDLMLVLDGDDDAAMQTGNATAVLETTLRQMLIDGYIRAYTLVKLPEVN